ncbi:MAG: hypothetical protein HOP07_14735 [Bacteriovoracaceae bacterium]|nr:hypothetical protein [Bacteriovoracaceae bacterium]
MKKKLIPKTIKIQSLKSNQVDEMFKLFEIFYENVSFDRFKVDLSAKTKVIILLDKEKKIQGFSTFYDFDFFHHKKDIRVLFSGDTIIAPDYWGTSALTMEFLKNMILLKLKYPFRPVWWFLISKGYKTYLLLANNFLEYYPRFDRGTPGEHQELIASLSEKFYPGKFNSHTGVIEFEANEHEHLKESIAPITNELMEKYPKIKFFNFQNPGWRKGDELACIGEVDPLLGVIHPFKILKKLLKINK